MIVATMLALFQVAGGNGLAATEDMTSTPDEASAIVNALCGTWRDVSIAVLDDPASGIKEGDEIVNIVIRKKTAGGRGFVTTAVMQSGEVSTDLGAYDPASKTFKVLGTSTRGGCLEAVLWKSGGNVVSATFTVTPLEKNEKQVKGIAEWHVSKNGRAIEIKVDANGIKTTISSTKLSD